MQRSRTEAIRTHIHPSNLKREITKIIISQNRERSFGQRQLFSKRWPLSNQNRTKDNMNTRKVKRHLNSDIKQATENNNNTNGLGAKWRYVGYFGSSLHPREEKFGCYHGSKACLGDLKSHVVLSYQWQVFCK